MLGKGQEISIGSRSSLPLHIDVQQPRAEPHIQQSNGSDESDLRELIRLQTVAISALEKSTKFLGESITLLQNHIQGNQSGSSTSTLQEAMHDNDLGSADAVQAKVVSSTSSDLADRARQNVFAMNTYKLENIAVGEGSQQTVILEGGGLLRARNITAGDGSVQLIGQLSGAALQSLYRVGTEI